MPIPTQGYRTADGKRVPGTTTILDRFKDAGGIIWWANRLALEPLMEIRAVLAGANNCTGVAEYPGHAINQFLALDPTMWDHKLAAQKAADAGTVAHEMVECWLRKTPFDALKYPDHLREMAEPAFAAFLQWAEQSRLEVQETEKALVSEKYRFGGTRDAIMVSGKRAIGDWKTSNAIYPEYLCQLAAYGLLDEEAGNTIDGGYHLVRFSKQAKPDDPVQFSHHYWSHLDAPRKAFLLMRELYDLMAQIKGLAK